jgi:hypothetical protein
MLRDTESCVKDLIIRLQWFGGRGSNGLASQPERPLRDFPPRPCELLRDGVGSAARSIHVTVG